VGHSPGLISSERESRRSLTSFEIVSAFVLAFAFAVVGAGAGVALLLFRQGVLLSHFGRFISGIFGIDGNLGSLSKLKRDLISLSELLGVTVSLALALAI
jgi:hypothetical protein